MTKRTDPTDAALDGALDLGLAVLAIIAALAVMSACGI